MAYEGLVRGVGQVSKDVFQTLEERYASGETDEFLKPILLSPSASGNAPNEGSIQDGDTLLFFNYRSDRMREITQALGIPPLPFKADYEVPQHIDITTMTQFKAEYPFNVIFPPQVMTNVLAEWLAKLKVCVKYLRVIVLFC